MSGRRSEDSMTERDREVLAAHSRSEVDGFASTRQIAGELGVTPQAAAARLRGMARRGLVATWESLYDDTLDWVLTEEALKHA